LVADGKQLAHEAAQRVARESYGRLVAFLAKRTRDVAQAEDALAEAFVAALKDWPLVGIPDNPDAWLIAVAKRKHIDVTRKNKSHADAAGHLVLLAEELEAMATSTPSIPDERLALMFACAHPALDPSVRSPLILQTVLGLTAEQIAGAFLVSPTTMGQRLSRAKAKIKVAGIPFRVPGREVLGERLETVLEAIYACFSHGWNEADHLNNALSGEALWLGGLVVELLPQEPECLGLQSLMLFVQSRRKARRSVDGDFVPLSAQDTDLWDASEISQAEFLLRRAGSMGKMGRYQLEAAIQSVHAARQVTGATDWHSLCVLYQSLFQFTGSVVVKLNWAVALTEAEGVEAGLEALPEEGLFPELENFQPYHAVRAELLARATRTDAALQAYGKAIALEKDVAVSRFLKQQAEKLRGTLN
jgi:RNA polymerase sigma-70 factor (ECF subfamily)